MTVLTPVCALAALTPERPVAALVDGTQVGFVPARVIAAARDYASERASGIQAGAAFGFTAEHATPAAGSWVWWE